MLFSPGLGSVRLSANAQPSRRWLRVLTTIRPFHRFSCSPLGSCAAAAPGWSPSRDGQRSRRASRISQMVVSLKSPSGLHGGIPTMESRTLAHASPRGAGNVRPSRSLARGRLPRQESPARWERDTEGPQHADLDREPRRLGQTTAPGEIRQPTPAIRCRRVSLSPRHPDGPSPAPRTSRDFFSSDVSSVAAWSRQALVGCPSRRCG